MKLYVGNLSYSTTEDTLRTLFSNYADVVSVKIKEDEYTGQSKGFGFIEIDDEIKAQRAIGGMNGKDVDGRRIRVSEAVENPRRRFGSGFSGERKFERRDRDDRDFSHRDFDREDRGRGNFAPSRDSSRSYFSRERRDRDERGYSRRENFGGDRSRREESGRFENRERRGFSGRRNSESGNYESRDDEY